jgi:hypothetical protein
MKTGNKQRYSDTFLVPFHKAGGNIHFVMNEAKIDIDIRNTKEN